MYTEISHFLLLHTILQEILRFFCLSIWGVLWLAQNHLGELFRTNSNPTANKRATEQRSVARRARSCQTIYGPEGPKNMGSRQSYGLNVWREARSFVDRPKEPTGFHSSFRPKSKPPSVPGGSWRALFSYPGGSFGPWCETEALHAIEQSSWRTSDEPMRDYGGSYRTFPLGVPRGPTAKGSLSAVDCDPSGSSGAPDHSERRQKACEPQEHQTYQAGLWKPQNGLKSSNVRSKSRFRLGAERSWTHLTSPKGERTLWGARACFAPAEPSDSSETFGVRSFGTFWGPPWTSGYRPTWTVPTSRETDPQRIRNLRAARTLRRAGSAGSTMRSAGRLLKNLGPCSNFYNCCTMGGRKGKGRYVATQLAAIQENWQVPGQSRFSGQNACSKPNGYWRCAARAKGTIGAKFFQTASEKFWLRSTGLSRQPGLPAHNILSKLHHVSLESQLMKVNCGPSVSFGASWHEARRGYHRSDRAIDYPIGPLERILWQAAENGSPSAPRGTLGVQHSIFFLLLTSCFFGTISNYVCSDFSIYNILTNSTADIPLFYKISATWSNHEGSLLLWCWLLSFNTFLFCISICALQLVWKNSTRASSLFAASFGPCFAPLTRLFSCGPSIEASGNCVAQRQCRGSARSRRETRFGCAEGFARIGRSSLSFENLSWEATFRCTNSLQFSREHQQFFITKTAFTASLILIFFTFFCVATSNPFLRTSIPSINSLAELNPILQDPVLAIHPPCIYAGYVASAIAFSLCMSSFFWFADSSKKNSVTAARPRRMGILKDPPASVLSEPAGTPKAKR